LEMSKELEAIKKKRWFLRKSIRYFVVC